MFVWESWSCLPCLWFIFKANMPHKYPRIRIQCVFIIVYLWSDPNQGTITCIMSSFFWRKKKNRCLWIFVWKRWEQTLNRCILVPELRLVVFFSWEKKTTVITQVRVSVISTHMYVTQDEYHVYVNTHACGHKTKIMHTLIHVYLCTWVHQPALQDILQQEQQNSIIMAWCMHVRVRVRELTYVWLNGCICIMYQHMVRAYKIMGRCVYVLAFTSWSVYVCGCMYTRRNTGTCVCMHDYLPYMCTTSSHTPPYMRTNDPAVGSTFEMIFFADIYKHACHMHLWVHMIGWGKNPPVWQIRFLYMQVRSDKLCEQIIPTRWTAWSSWCVREHTVTPRCVHACISHTPPHTNEALTNRHRIFLCLLVGLHREKPRDEERLVAKLADKDQGKGLHKPEATERVR